MRQHSSFLLRCWNLGRDEERIEIEHIQSGERALVTSLSEAIAWISSRSDARSPLIDDAPSGKESD